jgi:hypothetical protein
MDVRELQGGHWDVRHHSIGHAKGRRFNIIAYRYRCPQRTVGHSWAHGREDVHGWEQVMWCVFWRPDHRFLDAVRSGLERLGVWAADGRLGYVYPSGVCVSCGPFSYLLPASTRVRSSHSIC